jgi:hypothetical protein
MGGLGIVLDFWSCNIRVSTDNYLVEISYHKRYSKRGFSTGQVRGQFRADEKER